LNIIVHELARENSGQVKFVVTGRVLTDAAAGKSMGRDSPRPYRRSCRGALLVTKLVRIWTPRDHFTEGENYRISKSWLKMDFLPDFS
jgi:hypothetical protein